jgi:hypothetical protein
VDSPLARLHNYSAPWYLSERVRLRKQVAHFFVCRYLRYFNSFLNPAQPRVFATSSALSHARRAVATA